MTAAARRERREAGNASLALFVVAVLLALTGVGAVVALRRGSLPPDGHSVSAATASRVPGSPPAVPPGPPLHVRIPAIGVLAPLVPLGVNTDGTLEVPQFEEAGWYAGGSRPGDPGPAVIAAHFDSTTGPAVFYRLKELKPGDVVHVGYRAGTVTFSVRESRSFPKSRFPTHEVYGGTDGPALRLVTCDGTFDRKTRTYRSNLVVWADVISPPETAQW